MKHHSFPITSLLLASLLLLSACQEDNVLPVEGTSCPGGNNFIVQDGACACREGFILVGRPPSVLGEHLYEGVCIRPSHRGIGILATYDDCVCTELANNALNAMFLNFGDVFSASYFASESYLTIWRDIDWKDEPEGQDIYLEFHNRLAVPPLNDICGDYHKGMFGSLHEFFPNAQTRLEGKIRWWANWADFDDNLAPVDSCTITLERVTP